MAKAELHRAVLPPQQIRRLYDRVGRRQDLHRFYEDPPLRRLRRHIAFANVRQVLEFGCGTGRLAALLLEQELPSQARYQGLDSSRVMVELAARRLDPWRPRVRVEITDGSCLLPLPPASCDLVLCTYVLDLLSLRDIGTFLEEAHRVLRRQGQLALASLTWGRGPLSSRLTRLWSRLYPRHPAWFGGCRPLCLEEHLPSRHWRIHFREVVQAWGIPSEILIASPRAGP